MRRRHGGDGTGPVIAMILAICIAGYFAYAGVQGEYGVFRRIETQARITGLEAERDRLAEKVAALRARIEALSTDSLDLDLLDERARRVLGMVRADEVILR